MQKITMISMALLLGSASSSFAGQIACEFKQECFETEACGETSYSLSFDHNGDTVSKTNIVSDAETISANQISSKDGKIIGFVASRENGDNHLATVATDGTARYSVHMPESGVALYYKGMCKRSD